MFVKDTKSGFKLWLMALLTGITIFLISIIISIFIQIPTLSDVLYGKISLGVILFTGIAFFIFLVIIGWFFFGFFSRKLLGVKA